MASGRGVIASLGGNNRVAMKLRLTPAALLTAAIILLALVAFAAIAVVFVIALLAPVFLPLIGGGGGRADTGSADEYDEYIDGIGRQVAIAGDAAHFPDTLDITAVVPGGYITVDPDDSSVAIPPHFGPPLGSLGILRFLHGTRAG